MKLPLRQKKFRFNFLALAFLMPFCGMLAVMAFSQYHPFGRFAMLYSDCYHQYYPFFVSFRRALLRGDSLLFNWDVGMGVDFLGMFAYYLASPLNLLSVLVPESLLLDYFSLLVPIRLGFAGLFFAIFLKKLFNRNDFSISIFGTFYALCAWALGFQWNVMWMDTFALLPLVMLGMVSLLRERKFILYTLTLFLSVACNYYIGLFTCIFVALVFFCYEICRFQGWKRFFADLGWIALFSIIAIGMTAILSLPTLQALQTTQSSVNKFPTAFRLNIAKTHDWKGLLSAMRQVAGNMGGALEPNFKEGLPNLYCGVGSILLGFLFLASEDVKWQDKVCAVFLLLFINVSFIIRQLDYIWHGFHFTNMIPYRFSFLYSFVLLYMAYRAWMLRRRFDWIQVMGAAFLTAAVLCCSDHVMDTETLKLPWMELPVHTYLLYNGIALLSFTGVLLYGSLRQMPKEDSTEEEKLAIRRRNRHHMAAAGVGFLSIACVEMIANLLSFGLYFPGTSVSNYPKGTEEAASMIRYMQEREKKKGFFRAEVTHSQTLNDGALNGYNGISAFTSSANVKVTEFMRALGYGAKNTYNRYCFEESSPAANLFLNLKYMIDRDGKDKTSSVFSEVHHYGNVTLLKNEAYLPLGFLAELELAEVDFMGGDAAFGFQNDLFAAATGLEGKLWHRLTGDQLELLEDGLTVTDQNGMGFAAYSDCKGTANLTFCYLADRDGFACIHLNLPERNTFYVSVNGLELYRENISLPQMLAVKDVKTGDLIEVRVVCKEKESSTMTVTAAVMDMDYFWEGYDILNQSTLSPTSYGTTWFEGNIDCDRDGLLYTSIPQNGNWTAEVDGKPAEIVLTGDCMVSIPVTEGEHRITIQYHNAAFSLGWKITLGFSLIFLGFVQVIYRPDWKTLLPRRKEN